jgi:hypothetical protein
MTAPFTVACGDGIMNGRVQRICINDRLMREMMSFEMAPDHLDIIESAYFRQPLDSESVSQRARVASAFRVPC